jgi:glycosyltransferase involved in cell wall biosynthesis
MRMPLDRPRVSVIVSTYNRPDALRAVLDGLNAQTHGDFEVIIADDGSGKETRDMLQEIRERLPYPLIHIWQRDKGFRAAKARNKAVAASRGEYLIFLDGDCIPFPNFIEEHLRLAEPKWFVRGNRVMLSASFTQWVLENEVEVTQFRYYEFVKHRIHGNIKRMVPLLHLPLGPARKIVAKKWEGAKTCNLGVLKSDFMDLNGFDERYIGWGHEDADLVVRLIRSGIYRKEGNFSIPVLHLWHKMNDRSQLEKNEKRLQNALINDHIKAEQGISQYIDG